jgi:hypothetical protein
LAAPSQAHWQRACRSFTCTPLGLNLDSTISFTALKFYLSVSEKEAKQKKMKRANEKKFNTQIDTQKWILTTIVEIEKEKTLST